MSYTWDAENRLTATNNVSYTYDGDGRRVKKSNGALYWYGLGGEVLEETDLSGNLLNDYIYFNGQRIARVDASGGKYSYFTDPLGSTALVWGPGGTKQELDYYPFGGERVITNTLENHYKFTGMERDSESGLDHTLFRQYASNLGRWLSPDPDGGSVSNPQSLNRYGYVGNNPTNLTDPLGLKLMRGGDIFDGGGSAAGLYGSLSYGGLGGTGSCTIDSLDASCALTSAVLDSGAAIPAATACPNGNCTGVRVEQGPGGTTVITQTQTVTVQMPGTYVSPSDSESGTSWTTYTPGSTQTVTFTTTQTVNDVLLEPWQANVLGTAGTIAAPVASPWAPVTWYAASAGTAVLVMYGPAVYTAGTIVVMTHPAAWGCAVNFGRGFSSPPGAATSWCGMAGQLTSAIWNAW